MVNCSEFLKLKAKFHVLLSAQIFGWLWSKFEEVPKLFMYEYKCTFFKFAWYIFRRLDRQKLDTDWNKDKHHQMNKRLWVQQTNVSTGCNVEFKFSPSLSFSLSFTPTQRFFYRIWLKTFPNFSLSEWPFYTSSKLDFNNVYRNYSFKIPHHHHLHRDAIDEPKHNEALFADAPADRPTGRCIVTTLRSD